MASVVQALRRLKNLFILPPPTRLQEHSQPKILPPTILTQQHLQSMLSKMNIERIRRTIMLFDIRWLKEDSTSYVPDEEQIAQEAYSAMTKAVIHGRVLGVAEVRDKGFVATYGRLDNGSELLNLKYVLAESSSLG